MTRAIVLASVKYKNSSLIIQASGSTFSTLQRILLKASHIGRLLIVPIQSLTAVVLIEDHKTRCMVFSMWLHIDSSLEVLPSWKCCLEEASIPNPSKLTASLPFLTCSFNPFPFSGNLVLHFWRCRINTW